MRIRQIKKELHELLYTEVLKSGTIRLVSVLFHPNVSHKTGPYLS